MGAAMNGLGFDFGISPHGLPADLRQTVQETRCPESLFSLADAFAACCNGLSPVGSTFACTAQLGGVAHSDRSTSEAVRVNRLQEVRS